MADMKKVYDDLIIINLYDIQRMALEKAEVMGVKYGKFMDNCWISSQVMADMNKVYDDLIIMNL